MTDHPAPRDGDAATSLSIRAEADETRRASFWLDAFCRDNIVPDERIAELDLCLNEVLANVIEHGGEAGRGGGIELQLEIRGTEAGGEITLRVSDCGLPFDPLALEVKPRPRSLAEADLGGLGIALLRKFADSLAYRRSGGMNHLTVVMSWQVAPEQRATRAAQVQCAPQENLREGYGWVPLFSDVDGAQLAAALHGCDVVDFPLGTPVIRPGDINPYIYILLSGSVDIFLDAHMHEATATQVTAGECFGILSGIDGKTVTAMVMPRTDARVLRIPRETFHDRFMTLPGVAAKLMGALVERMRRSNVHALATLREQLELDHLRRELEMARRLQASMLPQHRPLFPGRSEIQVCGLMEPATKVGGDFFDAFFVDDRNLFFCVGDAAGHGVTAAMLMARTMGLLHMLAKERFSPPDLLGELNDRLADSNETSLFVTLLCGLLDVKSGHLVYANGGHCAPLVVAEGRAEPLPLPKGSVVGAMPGKRFAAMEYQLAPGAMLVCYTDGLIEAQNDAGEQFSEQRCLDIAAREGGDGPSALLDALYAALAAFTGAHEQEDDYTILAIRRRTGLPTGA